MTDREVVRLGSQLTTWWATVDDRQPDPADSTSGRAADQVSRPAKAGRVDEQQQQQHEHDQRRPTRAALPAIRAKA